MRINKRGKRTIVGLALTLAVTAATAVPMWADNPNNYQTNVTYTVEDSYTLSIPETVTLSKNGTMSMPISVTAVNIAAGKELQVKVDSGITNGSLILDDGSGNTVSLQVSLFKGGDRISNETVVAKFQGQNLTPMNGTGTLYFSETDNVNAGSYTGVIAFTAVVATTNI